MNSSKVQARKFRLWISCGVWLSLSGCTPMVVPTVTSPVLPPLPIKTMESTKSRPDTQGEGFLNMALSQLTQDMSLSVGARKEVLLSLESQPQPEGPLDRLRRAQLLLLQHQGGATQQALQLLQDLQVQTVRNETAELLPLSHWLDQWAKTQLYIEGQLEQLARQSQEMQGKADVLSRQIQELRAIEHHLSSRPGGDKNGTGAQP
ncbi:MAG: hypothetical protein G3H99_04175 [Ferrovum sp.]|nr:hypothetical protein [Ferrovum sp.]NDU87826.1 hypothetical protein [Ferrovum sp.]